MKYESAKAVKHQLLSQGRIWLESSPSGSDTGRPRQSFMIRKAPTTFGRDAFNAPQPSASYPMIAIGVARSPDGEFRPALRVMEESALAQMLVEEATEVTRGEVDIRHTGRITQHGSWAAHRHRPPMIGASICHYAETAGTLGCYVKDRATGALMILSNNHVIGRNDLATVGDSILQPGPADGGGVPLDRVAHYVRSVPLSDAPGADNRVDAALARPTPEIEASLPFPDMSLITGLGRLSSTISEKADLGDRVAKRGRTTDVTWGTVTANDFDALVVDSAVNTRRFVFNDQIEIEGDEKYFSEGGDSGSLIVNADMKPVGLLFCGSKSGATHGGGLTYANHIQAVLDALRVDIVG